MHTSLPLLLLLLVLTPACRAFESAPPPGGHLATVEEFRRLKEEGQYAEAARFLSADPRIWFGTREGAGEPWGVQGGPWADWDRAFHAHSVAQGWTVESNAASCISTEIND